MTCDQQAAEICRALTELRRTVTSSFRNDGGARAADYLPRAKALVETARDVLRREAWRVSALAR
jgi:hypothetical protein